MAKLFNKTEELEITLFPEHLFGRGNDKANTALQDPRASRIHAQIIWDATQWVIRDYSTNGTFINERPLTSTASTPLKLNDIIQFGSLQGTPWCVTNLDLPRCRLIPEYPELPEVELTGVTALPSEDAPEFQILPTGNGDWIYESNYQTTPLKGGDIIGDAPNQWRFVDCRPTSETENLPHSGKTIPLHSVRAHFDVSQSEEHVGLTLTINQQTIDLGQRNHHYLLLLLARTRLEHAKLDLNERERGWMHLQELVNALDQEETHINIQIYRMRKQLEELGVSEHPIIERRRGQLRFPYEQIEIVGGSKFSTGA